MSRSLRFLPVAVVLILIAAFVWRLANPPDSTVPSRMVGRAVPAFQLADAVPTMPGFTSAELATGKPRLVNLFASWCVPCITEVQVLQQLARRGVAIDGIAIRDRPEDVTAFLARRGDPYQRIGGDGQSQVQIAMGSSGVPESFIVDGRGIIRYQHIGPIEAADMPTILAEMEQAR